MLPSASPTGLRPLYLVMRRLRSRSASGSPPSRILRRVGDEWMGANGSSTPSGTSEGHRQMTGACLGGDHAWHLQLLAAGPTGGVPDEVDWGPGGNPESADVPVNPSVPVSYGDGPMKIRVLGMKEQSLGQNHRLSANGLTALPSVPPRLFAGGNWWWSRPTPALWGRLIPSPIRLPTPWRASAWRSPNL